MKQKCCKINWKRCNPTILQISKYDGDPPLCDDHQTATVLQFMIARNPDSSIRDASNFRRGRLKSSNVVCDIVDTTR